MRSQKICLPSFYMVKWWVGKINVIATRKSRFNRLRNWVKSSKMWSSHNKAKLSSRIYKMNCESKNWRNPGLITFLCKRNLESLVSHWLNINQQHNETTKTSQVILAYISSIYNKEGHSFRVPEEQSYSTMFMMGSQELKMALAYALGRKFGNSLVTRALENWWKQWILPWTAKKDRRRLEFHLRILGSLLSEKEWPILSSFKEEGQWMKVARRQYFS